MKQHGRYRDVIQIYPCLRAHARTYTHTPVHPWCQQMSTITADTSSKNKRPTTACTLAWQRDTPLSSSPSLPPSSSHLTSKVSTVSQQSAAAGVVLSTNSPFSLFIHTNNSLRSLTQTFTSERSSFTSTSTQKSQTNSQYNIMKWTI